MHCKPFLFFILFLGLSVSGFAQEVSADSIAKMSFLQFRTLFLVTQEANDTLLEKKYVDIFYKKFFKTSDTIEWCRGYFYKSYASYNSLETRLKYADSIIALSKHSNHMHYPTAGYVSKANNYYDEGLYSKAIDNYVIALDYAKKKNSHKEISYIKDILAEIKHIGGDYKGAKEIYKTFHDSIIKLPNYKEKHKADYYEVLYSLILEYINIKEIDSALLIIDNDISKLKPYKSKYGQLNLTYYDFLLLIGTAKYYKNEYQSAMDSLKKTLPHIDNYGKSFSHMLISHIYKKTRKGTFVFRTRT